MIGSNSDNAAGFATFLLSRLAFLVTGFATRSALSGAVLVNSWPGILQDCWPAGKLGDVTRVTWEGDIIKLGMSARVDGEDDISELGVSGLKT